MIHVLLDADGVLVDFVQRTCEKHGRDVESVDCWDYFKKWGLTGEEFWEPIKGREFWANLEPYDWALRLYRTLAEKYNVTIATSPSRDPGCASGKVDWLWKHFGENFENYMIGPQKFLMAKPNHILIDDNADTCKKFIALGGRAIVFPQPWNTDINEIPADPAGWALVQADRIASEIAEANEAEVEVHQ